MNVSTKNLLFESCDTSSEMSVEARNSFRELYTVHAHTVYTTSLAILKNADAAHDVVHDVFLRAWHQSGQFDPSRGGIAVWLRAVARNLSIDRLRTAQRVLIHETNAEDSSPECDESLSQLLLREQLESLKRALHKLPAVHRQLIELAYDKEMSQAEIAKHLGQPLGTVKSRIRQALAMLRTFAAELEPDETPAMPSWFEPASQAFTTLDADEDVLQARLRQAAGLNVLVVDDEEETVRLVSTVLRKFGLHTKTRTSARDGLAALHESWPDVVLSDLNMPDEDGYSLIGKARAIANTRGLRLRAAAFTSWASERERSRALVAGFDAYIEKPVHPLALIAAVASLAR